jgi:DNA polymerase
LPDDVRRALALRQEAGKASVSKLKAFLARASADGRIRGAFLYHAAGTGRWSSVGAQVHNLPRPRKEFEEAALNLKILFEAIRRADPAWLKWMYGDVLGRPLHLISDAIRGFLWAAPGHEFVEADYSNIEGAVGAWVAGETWKLQAMRDIIANPDLPDLYRRAAAAILNSTTDVITKKHPFRQSVGKVSELSMQFGGGVGAFRSMARNYSVKLEPLYEAVAAAAGETRLERARKRYAAACKRGEATAKTMPEKAWLAAEMIKLGWREQHPAFVAMWRELEDGARQAVQEPGTVVRVGRVAFTVQMGFLWLQLPSDRCLAYGSPRLREQVWIRRWDEAAGAWSDDSEIMGKAEAKAGIAEGQRIKIDKDAKSAVTALGVNSTTKKWERYALYGGLLFENAVQAIARDILANGMLKVEAAGYPIVLHVHDQIVSEVKRGWGKLTEFVKLMLDLPDIYDGLPLAAAGSRCKRFHK